MIETVREVGPGLGIAPTCAVLGLPTATYYRRSKPQPAPRQRPSPPRALPTAERAAVLEVLHESQFVDLAPAQVYAQLLDAERYLCSERTMYRILDENHEVRERRDQLRHPHSPAPELLATAPNQVWSWDIRKLIEQSCRRQGITPGQLTLHADHGPSMTSKSVALLLSDLAVTKTHSRPYVSNDNPFSEAQLKTMKYRPEFPERFGSIQDSRSFGHVFFPWYNTEHHHSGLGLLTPHEVHYGLAEKRVEARARVLAAAYAAHPERFVTGLPRPPALPTEVWINRPKAVLAEPRCVSEPEVVTNFAPRAPYSAAAGSTHIQVSPRIGAGEPFGSIDSGLHIVAVVPLNTEDLQ